MRAALSASSSRKSAHRRREERRDPRPDRAHAGDRHRRDPGQGRQRSQPDLAVTEHLCPHPRDEVVDRRRGLGLRDGREHRREIHPRQQHGDRLVRPEALPVERRQAQSGGERRQRREDAERLPSLRSRPRLRAPRRQESRRPGAERSHTHSVGRTLSSYNRHARPGSDSKARSSAYVETPISMVLVGFRRGIPSAVCAESPTRTSSAGSCCRARRSWRFSRSVARAATTCLRPDRRGH